MTKEEAYEIATLASDVTDKQSIWEAHAIMNTPSDPIEREKAMAAYIIAQTEYLEAWAALNRAQARIANKAGHMSQAFNAAVRAAAEAIEDCEWDAKYVARAILRAALPAEPTHGAMATLVQTLEATASRECPGAVAEILYRAFRAHLLGEDAKPRPAPSTDQSHAELSNTGRLIRNRPVRGEDA